MRRRTVMVAVVTLVVLAPAAPAAATSASRLKPTIVWKPIPFGARREREMAAYSKRHYGVRTWRLTNPHVIIEHYTDGPSFQSAWNYFAANSPHMGETPGVCAHFIIDTDGTILELVPTDIRCRHTVGLNHETIGIEHVGNSDGDVVGRPRVLRSSLALTDWLRCAYAIQRSNVIGHNESLSSPLYEELDPDFQGRTHGDMKPATMKRYRRKLGGC
jgi:N-acetylmuramoyl-L-alanine amidase